MKEMLMVFIGGGLGSVLRYFFSLFIRHDQASIPWPTFFANFISSLILGFLFYKLQSTEMNNSLKLLLMTGFCGGFSTFSTFSLENMALFKNGQGTLALTYITLSLVVCIGSVALGYFIPQMK